MSGHYHKRGFVSQVIRESVVVQPAQEEWFGVFVCSCTEIVLETENIEENEWRRIAFVYCE